jgi:hypothetical protein
MKCYTISKGLCIIVKGDHKGQYYSNKSNRQGQVDAEPGEACPRQAFG